MHDLKSGTRKRLVAGGSMPRYIPETPESGILVFGRDDHLWAVRLDLPSLTLIGVPIEVWKNVPMQPERGIVGYAIAREAGTLVYMNADRSIDQLELLWVDSAKGTATPLAAAPGLYVTPSIGPSGEIAVGIMAANDYITLIDDRGVSRRLTRGSNMMDAVWNAAGDAVYCRDSLGRAMHLPIANPESIAPVPGLEKFERITSCSPDGKLMLFQRPTNTTGIDIWLYHNDLSLPPEPLVATSDDEGEAVFSPDGKRIAYTQSQDGTPQVFVRDFPANGQGQQVSINGGTNPQWSADGRELYFRHDNDVLAATIPADGSRPGPPRVLFTGSYSVIPTNYARGVQDGRFLMLRQIRKPPTHLDVVLNWTADVKRKLDAATP